DRYRARGTKRRVQRRAVLGEVDLLARHEALRPAAHVASFGEREEKPRGLFVHALLRIIEKHLAVRDRVAREALRVGGKERFQIERRVTRMRGKRLPRGRLSETGRHGSRILLL